MRPLKIKRDLIEDEEDFTFNETEKDPRKRPLLMRMAEDKKNQLKRDSSAGAEYFMVQLPSGAMEKRLKLPLNVDPGVHSSYHLDQSYPSTPLPVSPIHLTLGAIKESESKKRTVEADSQEVTLQQSLKLDHTNLLDRPLGEELSISANPPSPIAEEEDSEQKLSNAIGM